MISVQVDISAGQVESALVALGDGYRDGISFNDIVVWAAERIGEPSMIKELIGRLGDTYTYLEETFGD